MSLPALLRSAALQHGERRALVAQSAGGAEVTLSFAELHEQVQQLAGWLHGQGVEEGQRVAVMLPNALSWPLTWLACAELGAVVVAVNTQLRSHDLAHLLADSGAQVVVTASGLAPETDVRVLVLPALLPPARSLPELHLTRDSLLSVQYTSGSTGPPKGCLLTHGYWLGIAEQAAAGDPGMRPDDVLLTAQPFSYIDPQWHLVTSLLLGCPLVLLDGFHPSTFWTSVVRHGVTVFYCLGAMPALLLTQELGSEHRLRLVLCSGIPAARHQELEQRTGVPWFELYGSTELGGAALGVSTEDHDRCLGSGSMGRPLPGFEARVQDGELLIRSPNFMVGYWQPDGAVVDPRVDGWFATGDLVTQRDGYYRFEGRCKDVVRRAGENVSAAEVEEVLATCDCVELVAVIPEADDLRGEELHAVVTGRQLDPEVLAAHCLERLARFKVPRYWTFADLPRTVSGKLDKGRLPAWLQDRGTPRYDRLTSCWSDRQDIA